MPTTNLSILSDFNQFTGLEHTQIVAMLTILALISLIVWAIIALSIIACQVTLLIIRLSQSNNSATSKKEGAHAN